MLPNNIFQDATGRLFLIGGAHSVLEMFQGQSLPNKQTIVTFHDNIHNRSVLCEAQSINYHHYVMPDPLVIAAEDMEHPYACSSYYRRYFNDPVTELSSVYPLDLLAGYQDRQLRTDTHYSPLGNAHIAADIANRMGVSQVSPILQAACDSAISTTYSGDLAAQCDPVPTETVRKPLPISGLRYATNGLDGGNNGIIDLIVSPNAKTERLLLIFGDSFFRGMLGELSRYWGRIVFFRTPFIHQGIVRAVAPDDILTGMAERYLSHVTPDKEAPDVLAMPLLAGRGTKPTKGFGELFSQLIDAKYLNGVNLETEQKLLVWPSTIVGDQVEEQTAFALWLHFEGRELGLSGEALQNAWGDVRGKWRTDSGDLLELMRRRGIHVGRWAG
jgi:hypothetical protein